MAGLDPIESGILNELLQQTSRTFYLTLRFLPRAIRPQISLAYLLARTTDTIADTEIVPVEQRLEALQKLRERILGTSNTALHIGELASHQGLPAERALLEKVEDSLAVLRVLAPEDLKLVREVLDTITSGQELDLKRFGGAATPTAAGVPQIIALPHRAALDDYTYRVAGCVGRFWTGMCLRHLFSPPPTVPGSAGSFEELGVWFGQGLQLVNILRDLPMDLQKGRCYLPADELLAADLRPADLLSPANEAKLLPIYIRYLDLAESHLAAGWEYTNRIPFRRLNLRLACAWPILIGRETIQRLRGANVLDFSKRIKINRADVRRIMFRSTLRSPFTGAWRRLAPLPAELAGNPVARQENLT